MAGRRVETFRAQPMTTPCDDTRCESCFPFAPYLPLREGGLELLKSRPRRDVSLRPCASNSFERLLRFRLRERHPLQLQYI